jgi:hypothetical protein
MVPLASERPRMFYPTTTMIVQVQEHMDHPHLRRVESNIQS